MTIEEIARTTPFRYDDIEVLHERWNELAIVKDITQMAMATGLSLSYVSATLEGCFESTYTQQNTRAIAELQIILLQKGWY